MRKRKCYIVQYRTLTGAEWFTVDAANMTLAIEKAKLFMTGFDYLKTFGRYISLNESFKGKPRKF